MPTEQRVSASELFRRRYGQRPEEVLRMYAGQFVQPDSYAGLVCREAREAIIADQMTPVSRPARTRKKTLFCVVRKGEPFEIKGYHSLKSARRHEPKEAYIEYATPGDINRARLQKMKVPDGVIYSKLGATNPEQIVRNRRRRRRNRPAQTNPRATWTYTLDPTYIPRATIAEDTTPVEQVSLPEPPPWQAVIQPAEIRHNTPDSEQPTPSSNWTGVWMGDDVWFDDQTGTHFQVRRRTI